MGRQVSKDTMASVKPEAHDPLESMGIPTEPTSADPRTDEQRRGNLLQENEQQFEQLSDDQKLSKLCSNPGLKTVERGQYFITLDAEGPRENIRCLVTIRELEGEAGFVGIRKLAESWTFMFVIMKIVTELKFRSDLCFKMILV